MGIQLDMKDGFIELTIRPERKETLIAILLVVPIVGILVMCGKLIEQALTDTLHPFFIVAFLLFLWLAYKNLFGFYWATLGYETVEIHEKYIKLSKHVGKLKESKEYIMANITELKVYDYRNDPGASGTAMFGFSNVNVQFKYGKRTEIIGKQITQEEAERIILVLRNYIPN
ncbi:hypothetical protein EV198_1646 [Roseivirga ehrenbergii]|uniref:DUF304 domain-containing protein n=1 Tax=Roseivirga ehrenbergii (strain DSM 102268 / JCM 13514 / KCTC 12282 / NCIMB 14502 / KMM 6017) TaxID=279360 RepID=A0A150XRY9_ROSEK|nr:hypothetical protein [Roseivirga ehrenbergii]KYG81464.1 hypothetical protein MB14_12785 [Roseivirga ehrenbergii]TCL10614.1 hypothetical protein EV198_1646 [Roseivirga ehrenbergii]